MKGMLRILRLVKSYKTRIAGYTLLVIFSSVFSVVSITMAIPFLNIIFDRSEANQSLSEYSGDAANLFARFMHLIQEIKIQQGAESALLYVSLMLVFLFFLKKKCQRTSRPNDQSIGTGTDFFSCRAWCFHPAHPFEMPSLSTHSAASAW